MLVMPQPSARFVAGDSVNSTELSVFHGSFQHFVAIGGDLSHLAAIFQGVFNGEDWKYGLPLDNYILSMEIFERINADLILHFDGERVVSAGVGYDFDRYPKDSELTVSPKKGTLIGAGAPKKDGYFIDSVLTLEAYRRMGLGRQAFYWMQSVAAKRKLQHMISWTESSVFKLRQSYFLETDRTPMGRFQPPGLNEEAVLLVGPADASKPERRGQLIEMQKCG